MFYELLFELSMADGHLDPAEESILSEAIPIFGLDHDLFNQNKRKFGADVSLIESSGGVFEVKMYDEYTDSTHILFSKKELERFPEENEVENNIWPLFSGGLGRRKTYVL